MAKLTDIKTKFNTSRIAVGGINSYVFDNMGAINMEREKEFPAMLMKPPLSNFSAPDKSTKDWKIDFFLFDIWNLNSDNEVRTLEQVWESLEGKGMAVIADVLTDRPTYGMVSPSSEPKITYGYPMHNDKLVGVRFEFTLRAFYSC